MTMNDEQVLPRQDEAEQHARESVERETLDFFSRPMVVVGLPDGRRGVVMKGMCEGVEVDAPVQVRRL